MALSLSLISTHGAESCDSAARPYSHNGKKDGDIIYHSNPKNWDIDWGVANKGRSKECYALLSDHYRWFSEAEAHQLAAKYPSYTWNGRNHGVFEATDDFIADLDHRIDEGV